MTERRGHGRRGRALRAALVSAALLLPAPLLPTGSAQAPKDGGAGKDKVLPPPAPAKGDKKPPGAVKELKGDKAVIVSDKLTLADPEDKVRAGSRAKVYTFRPTAGQLYTITVATGGSFNPFVRLVDAAGKEVTDADGQFLGPMPQPANSSVYFRPKKADTYRIIVTTFHAGQTGAFSLGIIPWADISGGETGLSVTDKLTAADPIDPGRGGFAKIYPVKMTAGRRYVIDLISGDYDAYLRLEDSAGRSLAENDDNGVSLNSRIPFTPGRTDTYRLIATSLGAGPVGKFTLWVTPVRPGGRSDPPPPPTVPESPFKGMVPGMHGGMPIGPGMPMRAIGNQATIGDITITAEQPLVPLNRGMGDTHGYVEYRLTVRNESAEAHRVAVTVPRSRPGGAGGNYLRSLRRAIEVGPKSAATLSLFQPDLPIHFGNDLEVEIDGQVQRETLVLNLQSNRGRGLSGMHGGPVMVGGAGPQVPAYVLTPQPLAQVLDNNAYKSAIDDPRAHPGVPRHGVFGSRGGMENGKSFSYAANHAFSPAPEPKAWGCERWLGLSCFDGVALRVSQLDDLPAATRDALWRYVECGGGLLLVGEDRVPGGWLWRYVERGGLLPAGEVKVPDGWKRRQGSVEGLTAYYPGFGQCLVVEQADPARWDPAQWRAILDMWEQSAQPWQHVRSANDANALFPVVEDRGVPVRGLFAAMLVFAILIGPVNINLLKRKKRRLWLLWTVPVFSLLTCAAVFGFMMLSEGLTGQVRAQGVTVLDEVSQRAASVSWLGVYSPITPGDGLHFGYDTEVTPQLRDDPRRHYREGSGRTIDWTGGQHFQSGWVKALVPAHFTVRSSEQRLERLAVRRESDGSLKAVNALKAPVVKLWLADAGGKIHTAENVPAGKEAALKRSDLRAEGKEEALREAFAGDWLTLSNSLPARPEEVLRPGTYLAVLDGAPFLEKGLRSAQPRPGQSVVFGILKEVPGDAR
jgi:hypothetical protein